MSDAHSSSSSCNGALLVNVTSDPAEVGKVRHQIEAFSRQYGFSDQAVDEIGLCVNEALANVIRHAYADAPGQPIELTATVCGGALTVSIRDWGVSSSPPATLPKVKADPLQPGGLGLICLGRLMDRVTFTPQRPNGMLLEMVRTR